MAPQLVGNSSVDPRIDPLGYYLYALTQADPFGVTPQLQPPGSQAPAQQAVQQAAVRESVEQWPAVPVQRPDGRWVYRLQNPDDPSDFRNFGYGKGDSIARQQYETRTGQPVSRADEIQLNRDMAQEARDRENRAILALRAKEERADRVAERRLRQEQLGLARQEAQANATHRQAVIGLQNRQLTADNNRFKAELGLREDDMHWRQYQGQVEGIRYTNELQRQGDALAYNAQVQAWDARNRRYGDILSFIGQALSNLTA